MPKYEQVWAVVAGGLCATGLVAAVHGWPLVVVLAASLTGGMLGVTMALPWLAWSSSWTVPVAKVMVFASAATWILMGVTHVAGVAGPAAVVAVALGAPALDPVYVSLAAKVGWRDNRTGSTRAAASAPVLGEAAADRVPVVAGAEAILDEQALDVPDLMTVEDLCHAWRSSYVALQRAMTPESRCRVVGMRALYLDELERRGGPAVQAWLSSGARAASDPGRYLAGSRPDLMRRERRPRRE